MRGRANRENKLTNPALQIAQINGLIDSTQASLILADEWNMFYASNVGVCRGQLVAVPTPRGGTTRLRFTVNTVDTSLTSSEYLFFWHRIEGSKMAEARFGSAQAKQLIARFGWRSPAGTFMFALRNGTT